MWCDMWCDMWGGRGADKYPLEHATGLRTVHGTVPFARGDGGSCGVCSVCCVERFDYVARYDKERFFVCSAPGRTRNAGAGNHRSGGRATVSASRTLARPWPRAAPGREWHVRYPVSHALDPPYEEPPHACGLFWGAVRYGHGLTVLIS